MLDPFDLNFRHLRALPLIARHKRMGAAAEAVSLSQPALTQGLAKIERQLGVPLFSRELTGMEPTAEGLALIARIEPALRQLGEGVRQAGRSPRGFARPDHLMTATQLRAFLALADAGSYIEAAHVTRWSQPALHRAVRDLQQLCGALLVERRGRGVVLTRDGRRLAR
ncbi:MAG: LysR family transcriptional regulator, partial [Sphingomonas bacterium]